MKLCENSFDLDNKRDIIVLLELHYKTKRFFFLPSQAVLAIYNSSINNINRYKEKKVVIEESLESIPKQTNKQTNLELINSVVKDHSFLSRERSMSLGS